MRTLVEHDLVDGFRLMIALLALSGGKRFFGMNGASRALRLVDSRVSTTGALLVRYERES